MLSDPLLIETRSVPADGKEPGPCAERTFMGRYMPFVGVNYYYLLGEREIISGRPRVGPTGWHPPEIRREINV